MANIFNAAEVVDMGVEKEKKRRDFYAAVAKKFKNKPEMFDLFSRLKEWEEQHIKKFTEIRNSVKNYEIVESYQGEFGAYMRALVEDKLYKEVTASGFAKHVKNPETAIRYSIGFEKDAILFFAELTNYMQQANKEKVQALVDEEKQHIIYLTNLKRKLKLK